jgi:hypothetical protein
MSIIDRSSFRAAAARDPEVCAELMAERRREANRQAAWLRERRSLQGVGDVLPERFSPASETELLARAERAVADRRAFRASPEGRFLTALEEMEEVVACVRALADEARAARSRGFEGERGFCRRKADGVGDLARRLRAAALDASLAAAPPPITAAVGGGGPPNGAGGGAPTQDG